MMKINDDHLGLQEGSETGVWVGLDGGRTVWTGKVNPCEYFYGLMMMMIVIVFYTDDEDVDDDDDDDK